MVEPVIERVSEPETENGKPDAKVDSEEAPLVVDLRATAKEKRKPPVTRTAPPKSAGAANSRAQNILQRGAGRRPGPAIDHETQGKGGGCCIDSGCTVS